VSRIFVDTGAFIAVLSDADRYHGTALRLIEDSFAKRIGLVTTNHVIAETCNWLLKDRSAGHRLAVRFGGFVSQYCTPAGPDGCAHASLSHREVSIVYATPTSEERAWTILRKYDTSGFSFTDCVSFAVMESLSITKALTFDEHFDIMGFERI